MRRLIVIGLLLLSTHLFTEIGYAQELSSEELQNRSVAIEKTLRCVVCQNQSIHDSNAPLANDMRRLVRQRVEAGDSDDQVRDYLRERYGDYVLMSPPMQQNTLVLWFGPFVLLLIAGSWFGLRMRKLSKAGPTAAQNHLSEDERKRIDAALSVASKKDQQT